MIFFWGGGRGGLGWGEEGWVGGGKFMSDTHIVTLSNDRVIIFQGGGVGGGRKVSFNNKLLMLRSELFLKLVTPLDAKL